MKLDHNALPLTRAQLDIWLAEETGHSSTEWQLGVLARFDGAIDRELLGRAIRHVMKEAEPARAAIFEADGRVFQQVIDDPEIGVAFYDLSDSSHPVQEARRMALEIQRTPMPAAGPLFKFALFQTWEDEFYLFGCFHHIVIDGTGITLLAHRIATVYDAMVSGNALPPAFFGSLQNLIDYESDYEASPEYLEDEAYWAENLPMQHESDTRWAEAVGGDPAQPVTPVRLDPTVLRRVQELSQEWNVPRSSVLTAACALLVRGWSAGSEVVLDFPVSRRVRPESKTLPAMVSGVVPLVLRVSPETTVADFCNYVDERVREALQHQRFPVYALERKSRPRTEQPARRVSVNFMPSALTLDFAGVEASASFTNPGQVGDFGLIFSGAGDQLFFSTSGNAGPFAGFDLPELAKQLERVLVAMTADSGRPVSSVGVLGEGERERLEAWGNRGAISAPVSQTSIPEAFAAQVARAPEAVAVRFEGSALTYRELDEASNRLAHLLMARGVRAGDRVGVLLPRTAQAVVAILAVVKVGAAYVPIDPSVPAARVGFVLGDAGPAVVITTAVLAERVVDHGVSVVDVADPGLVDQPAAAPPMPVPEEIAYIIYTSGTTGVPKGVAVGHRCVTGLLETLDAEM
ncbi:AMP-binding protein, partial [Mycolicibacterium pulveris]|uniref:AMP-binding protein n=1 Tax=Mycolicibacterium pulveris TaxID=36813 RepID=UPI003CFB54F5